MPRPPTTEEIMVTVCTGGWSQHLLHATETLKDDGKNDGLVSHGMCDRCSMLMEAEITARSKKIAAHDGFIPVPVALIAAREAEAYADYLAGRMPDPRD
jgi:hypothetical protein